MSLDGPTQVATVLVPGLTATPAAAGVAVAPGCNSVATLPAPEGSYKVATFNVTGTLTLS